MIIRMLGALEVPYPYNKLDFVQKHDIIQTINKGPFLIDGPVSF